MERRKDIVRILLVVSLIFGGSFLALYGINAITGMSGITSAATTEIGPGGKVAGVSLVMVVVAGFVLARLNRDY